MSCEGMVQTNFPINNKKVVKLIEGCYYLTDISFLVTPTENETATPCPCHTCAQRSTHGNRPIRLYPACRAHSAPDADDARGDLPDIPRIGTHASSRWWNGLR